MKGKNPAKLDFDQVSGPGIRVAQKGGEWSQRFFAAERVDVDGNLTLSLSPKKDMLISSVYCSVVEETVPPGASFKCRLLLTDSTRSLNSPPETTSLPGGSFSDDYQIVFDSTSNKVYVNWLLQNGLTYIFRVQLIGAPGVNAKRSQLLAEYKPV